MMIMMRMRKRIKMVSVLVALRNKITKSALCILIDRRV